MVSSGVIAAVDSCSPPSVGVVRRIGIDQRFRVDFAAIQGVDCVSLDDLAKRGPSIFPVGNDLGVQIDSDLLCCWPFGSHDGSAAEMGLDVAPVGRHEIYEVGITCPLAAGIAHCWSIATFGEGVNRRETVLP